MDRNAWVLKSATLGRVTRIRNAKGQLEDSGHREVELPRTASPRGWVRADGTQAYEPSASVTFDRSGRPGSQLAPLSGQAAITTIFRFFNLHARERREGKLDPDKQLEKLHLQVQLVDPEPRGLRGWMRLPVDVDVLVGPRRSAGRMTDLAAGGVRIEDVVDRFMVGSRFDVIMPHTLGARRGTIVFPTRVAWSNDMRRTLGLEFTAAPRWNEG